MKAPESHPEFNKNYLKLNKVIYGLKQNGLGWNNELNIYFKKIGFKRLLNEPHLYKKENEKKSITCILGVYVDDILIAGSEDEIKSFKKNKK